MVFFSSLIIILLVDYSTSQSSIAELVFPSPSPSIAAGPCAQLSQSPFSGCCVGNDCRNEDHSCFCDLSCYFSNDCCSDIESIGCYLPTNFNFSGNFSFPLFPTPTPGSCLSLNLSYSGCCNPLYSNCSSSTGTCFCDADCYANSDCCSDIESIGCSRMQPTPTPSNITGSCVALNLSYSGCCEGINCNAGGCNCNEGCFQAGNCCEDIGVIGCTPPLVATTTSSNVTPLSTPTMTPQTDSCLSLNLPYSGCCNITLSGSCFGFFSSCRCDPLCYTDNTCCSDIESIGCYNTVSTTTPLIALTTSLSTASFTTLPTDLSITTLFADLSTVSITTLSTDLSTVSITTLSTDLSTTLFTLLPTASDNTLSATLITSSNISPTDVFSPTSSIASSYYDSVVTSIPAIMSPPIFTSSISSSAVISLSSFVILPSVAIGNSFITSSYSSLVESSQEAFISSIASNSRSISSTAIPTMSSSRSISSTSLSTSIATSSSIGFSSTVSINISPSVGIVNAIRAVLTGYTRDTFTDNDELQFKEATVISCNNYCSSNVDFCSGISNRKRQNNMWTPLTVNNVIILSVTNNNNNGIDINFFVLLSSSGTTSTVLPVDALDEAVKDGVRRGTYMNAGFNNIAFDKLTTEPPTLEGGIGTSGIVAIVVVLLIVGFGLMLAAVIAVIFIRAHKYKKRTYEVEELQIKELPVTSTSDKTEKGKDNIVTTIENTYTDTKEVAVAIETDTKVTKEKELVTTVTKVIDNKEEGKNEVDSKESEDGTVTEKEIIEKTINNSEDTIIKEKVVDSKEDNTETDLSDKETHF